MKIFCMLACQRPELVIACCRQDIGYGESHAGKAEACLDGVNAHRGPSKNIRQDFNGGMLIVVGSQAEVETVAPQGVGRGMQQEGGTPVLEGPAEGHLPLQCLPHIRAPLLHAARNGAHPGLLACTASPRLTAAPAKAPGRCRNRVLPGMHRHTEKGAG